jgi:hypothetical protein
MICTVMPSRRRVRSPHQACNLRLWEGAPHLQRCEGAYARLLANNSLQGPTLVEHSYVSSPQLESEKGFRHLWHFNVNTRGVPEILCSFEPFCRLTRLNGVEQGEGNHARTIWSLDRLRSRRGRDLGDRSLHRCIGCSSRIEHLTAGLSRLITPLTASQVDGVFGSDSLAVHDALVSSLS